MKKNGKIRLMIVDDHFVVRMGLTASVTTEPDMVVVAGASSGEQALELYPQHEPDIVLVDLRLPGWSGVETTAALCEKFPEARIIIFSTYEGDEDIYRALQAGARGYVSKNAAHADLVQAIRTVYSGQKYLSATIAASLAARVGLAELSAREVEVLELVARGMSNKEIGAALNITEGTVKLHINSSLKKLNASDRTQAVTTALHRGILHLS
jgi:two-component system NarL family response regulator